ncbi:MULTISPECIES: hypothetical protein [Paenibacillus]|uniref:hypothetical protein n=1 Tax=Paenibacillus TaxID=44249 RepID=UPI001F227316|nr:hypothetical protein [Paenibacillus sp. JJ-223]CAH1191366.1 hypothetical protein PAECIP111890_00426 [Paenibacillus sp. JJ-223]
MGEVWTSSMHGAPWTIGKMNKAIKQLGHRALISFVIDIDKLEDLQELDKHVFAKRPDLVLSIRQIDMKGRYTEELLQIIADLKHITALQLNLQHHIDLSILGKLERLQFLSITSKKPVNLNFTSNFRNLQYLSLYGEFVDLTPIGDATELDTLILSTTIHEVDFVRQLTKLECLFIHDCTLKGSLAALANSTVKMLSLANIRNLTNLDDIASMHNLTYLRLSLSKVEALCDFSKMHNLRQLELDNMKALKHIDLLWSAPLLEMLELRQISTSIKAKDLEALLEMEHLQQLDFQFIDFNKGRIAALRDWFKQAGKEHILYENIAEDKRMKSMWRIHLQNHIG